MHLDVKSSEMHKDDFEQEKQKENEGFQGVFTMYATGSVAKKKVKDKYGIQFNIFSEPTSNIE